MTPCIAPEIPLLDSRPTSSGIVKNSTLLTPYSVARYVSFSLGRRTVFASIVASLRVPHDLDVHGPGGFEVLQRLLAELRRRKPVAAAQQELKLVDPRQERAGLVRGPRDHAPGLDVNGV